MARGSKVLKERLSKIGQWSTETANKVAEMELLFNQNSQKFINLRNQVGEQSEMIGSLNEQVNGMDEEIESLKIIISEKEKMLKHLRNKIAYMNNRKSDLTQNVTNISANNILEKYKRKRKLQKPSGSPDLCKKSKLESAGHVLTFMVGVITT